MRSFPPEGYVRLYVRCCCNPLKILGTLDLPEKYAKQGKFVVPIAPPGFNPFDRNAKPDFLQATIEVRVFVEFIDGQRFEELAVYSDDHPPEFWRQFNRFLPLSVPRTH